MITFSQFIDGIVDDKLLHSLATGETKCFINIATYLGEYDGQHFGIPVPAGVFSYWEKIRKDRKCPTK